MNPDDSFPRLLSGQERAWLDFLLPEERPGYRLLREIQVNTGEVEGRELAGLDPGEQAQLRTLLQKMMRSLDLFLPGDARP